MKKALSLIVLLFSLFCFVATCHANGKSFEDFLGRAQHSVTIKKVLLYDKIFNYIPLKNIFNGNIYAITVKYMNGYSFLAYYFEGKSDKLLVYNHGHDGIQGTFSDDNAKILFKNALDSGMGLLITFMPLSDDVDIDHMVQFNNVSHKVRVTTSNHGVLEFFDSRNNFSIQQEPENEFHFLKYFVDPILVSLQVIQKKYNDITYVGLSGGGWTGLILSSVKNPINRYILVAGFLPEEARGYSKNIGDTEQFSQSVYKDFPYRYFLNNLNKTESYLIYNSEDSCCFQGTLFKDCIDSMAREYTGITIRIRESKKHDYDSDEIMQLIAGSK